MVADRHAPVIQKHVRGMDNCPWLNRSIKVNLRSVIIFSGKPEQQITRRTGRGIDALEIASRLTSRRRKRLTIDVLLMRVVAILKHFGKP